MKVRLELLKVHMDTKINTLLLTPRIVDSYKDVKTSIYRMESSLLCEIIGNGSGNPQIFIKRVQIVYILPGHVFDRSTLKFNECNRHVAPSVLYWY